MGANLLDLAQLAATAPAEFLIASVWQGLLLTAAAWVGLQALRQIAPELASKIAPRTRFILWMIVFMLAALVPFSTLFQGSQFSGSPQVLAPVHTPGLLSIPHLPAIWAVAIVGLWAFASLLSLARLALNGYRLHVLSRTSTPISGEAFSEELNSVLARARLISAKSRPVKLCLSSRIDSPIAIGFFRPAIVIPQWLASKLTPPELNQIVMHELAHLERRDDWTNLVQKVLRALFPLNPALLWAERQLCSEREMACDDAVLSRSISPREYAACLTSLAEKRLLRRAQALAPAAWRRRSELAERVHRILKSNRKLSPLRSRPVVLASLAGLLCAGAALARCPRLVTFTVAKTSLTPAVQAQVDARGERQAISPARFEQVTLRTVSSPESLKLAPPRVRVKHRRSATRPAHLRSFDLRQTQARRLDARLLETQLQQAHLMQTRVFEARFVQADKPPASKPVQTRSAAQIVFSVWEFSPSLPTVMADPFSSPEFAAFRAPAGWIVIRL